MSTSSVFIIDDDPDFLDVARAVLGRVAPALDVHAAGSATPARALFLRAGADIAVPAFVVLDFHLPDCTGPALLAELRACAPLRRVPVLVLSQFIWPGDASAAFAAGASACRAKPSNLRALGELFVAFWKEHAHGSAHPPG